MKAGCEISTVGKWCAYRLPVVISRCWSVLGPMLFFNQSTLRLILASPFQRPVFTTSATRGKPPTDVFVPSIFSFLPVPSHSYDYLAKQFMIRVQNPRHQNHAYGWLLLQTSPEAVPATDGNRRSLQKQHAFFPLLFDVSSPRGSRPPEAIFLSSFLCFSWRCRIGQRIVPWTTLTKEE